MAFAIHDRTLLHHAAEGRLDMSARAAEPVIQVEVAEGGVEIVLQKPMDHAAAEPDAFRIAGRTGHLLGDFGQIVQRAA